MSYLIYILAPIVVFLVLAISVTLRAADSPKSGTSAQPAKAPAAQTSLPPAREMAAFSKTKLRQMLAKIETSPAPKMQMGAMCYRMAMPPERIEYTCPICNQKTLYVFSKNGDGEKSRKTQWLLNYDLTAARRLIKELQKYTSATSLRENDFCDNCNPKRGTPNLGIIIRYDDGTKITTDHISSDDLRILVGFFSGALDRKTSNDGAMPLQKDMPRLKQLLGEPTNPASPEKKQPQG